MPGTDQLVQSLRSCMVSASIALSTHSKGGFPVLGRPSIMNDSHHEGRDARAGLDPLVLSNVARAENPVDDSVDLESVLRPDSSQRKQMIILVRELWRQLKRCHVALLRSSVAVWRAAGRVPILAVRNARPIRGSHVWDGCANGASFWGDVTPLRAQQADRTLGHI